MDIRQPDVVYYVSANTDPPFKTRTIKYFSDPFLRSAAAGQDCRSGADIMQGSRVRIPRGPATVMRMDMR